MANDMREANFRRSERAAGGGPERDHAEAPGGGRGGRFRIGSSGSPFHTERLGKGPVQGAGELRVGQGPGRAALRVRPQTRGRRG